MATRRGPYPYRDGGVEVRRIFHKLRSLAIEPVNGLFKNIFEWRGQMPVKSRKRCQVFALGAILLYQIVLLYQYQRQQPVGVGIKALEPIPIGSRSGSVTGCLCPTGIGSYCERPNL